MKRPNCRFFFLYLTAKLQNAISRLFDFVFLIAHAGANKWTWPGIQHCSVCWAVLSHACRVEQVKHLFNESRMQARMSSIIFCLAAPQVFSTATLGPRKMCEEVCEKRGRVGISRKCSGILFTSMRWKGNGKLYTSHLLHVTLTHIAPSGYEISSS